MLGEISSEIAIQGAFSQAPSATSNRPVQTSSPTGEELAKPIDNIQVKHKYHSENPLWLVNLRSKSLVTPYKVHLTELCLFSLLSYSS